MESGVAIRALRELYGDAVPATARGISSRDVAALAWELGGHGFPAVAVALQREGSPRRLCLLEGDMEALDPEWLTRFEMFLRSAVTLHPAPLRYVGIHPLEGNDARGDDVSEARARARALRSPQAAAAAAFVRQAGIAERDFPWEWVSDPMQGPSAIAFCRENPWLAQTCAASPEARQAILEGRAAEAAREGAFAYASLRAGHTGETVEEAADFLVGSLAWFRLPGYEDLWRERTLYLRAMSSLPRDVWPAPLAGDTDTDSDGWRDMAAFLMIAPFLETLSGATDRPLSSVLGRTGTSWHAYLARIHARLGLGDPGEPNPVRNLMVQAAQVSASVNDMAGAFGREVVAPLVPAMADGPLSHVTALRCGSRALIGDRTLAALCEVSRGWHRRVDAIRSFVVPLRGGDGAGPALFADEDLGAGLFATCLRTPADLAAEGAKGPDAAGVPGLDHCVGTFVDRVLSGETGIVSIRRTARTGGYERLSTVEVDFRRVPPAVRQHHGRGNSSPPPEAVAALSVLLGRVGPGARQAVLAHEPAMALTTSGAIRQAGAWGAVRDLWSFALTRPQRVMGPEEFLMSVGIPER